MYQFKFIIILIITFLAESIIYGKKEHREIDSEFSNEISTELDLTNVKDKCAVKISNIVDIRRDKKTVGKYRKRAVIINNSDQFLKSIVKSFETRNIDLIMPSQNNPSKVIVPEINLVKI